MHILGLLSLLWSPVILSNLELAYIKNSLNVLDRNEHYLSILIKSHVCRDTFHERYNVSHPQRIIKKKSATIYVGVELNDDFYFPQCPQCRRVVLKTQKIDLDYRLADYRHPSSNQPAVVSEAASGLVVTDLTLKYKIREIDLMKTNNQNEVDHWYAQAKDPSPAIYIGFVKTFDYLLCSYSPIYEQLDAPQEKPRNWLDWNVNKRVQRQKDYYSGWDRDLLYLFLEEMNGVTLYVQLVGYLWYIPQHRHKKSRLVYELERSKPSMDFLRVVLIQILSTLWHAIEEVEFTHWDLHTENIIFHYDPDYQMKNLFFDFIINQNKDSGASESLKLEPNSKHHPQRENADGKITPSFRYYGSDSPVNSRINPSRFSSFNYNPKISYSICSKTPPFAEYQEYTPRKDEETFNRNIHRLPRLRFFTPLSIIDNQIVKIIDLGRAFTRDPKTNTAYHLGLGFSKFNPLADIRYIAFSIIQDLPVNQLRYAFCHDLLPEEKEDKLPEWCTEARKDYDELLQVLYLMIEWDQFVHEHPSSLNNNNRDYQRLKEHYSSDPPDSVNDLDWLQALNFLINPDYHTNVARLLRNEWFFKGGVVDKPEYEEERKKMKSRAKMKIYNILTSPFFAKYRINFTRD